MGFYPKHLRRKQHRRNMRLIATAALSGCTFQRRLERAFVGTYNYNGDEQYRTDVHWGIIYDDGKQSRSYATKCEAAAVYLTWWFVKQDMWPGYR